MIYLKDLAKQWPWNPQAPEDFSDKEIYTHRIDSEDASKVWRVPVLPPMDGFAFVGVRVSVFGKTSDYTVVPHLVLGETKKDMFGLPWDNTVTTNGSWAPLGFPLTHKMIAITEDGLDLLIVHPEAYWGKVELVAQRFQDILEDESQISYLFMNHRTDKVEWILDQNNLMFKPNPLWDPVYPRQAKLIPSVLRLLDSKRNEWTDTSQWWPRVRLPIPLLE